MDVTELAAALACVLGACAVPDGEVTIPSPDQDVFRKDVYPILLRDCAFPGCHGTHDRFFAVFGPGRVRLDPKTPIYDPATELELALSYTRAASMLDPEDRAASLLLRKPIPVGEGGAGHRGDDLWGRPVFHTRADARYTTLVDWVMR